MRTKCVLGSAVLVGILIVSGCQGPAPCPTGEQLRIQGKLTEAVDAYEQCMSTLRSDTERQEMQRTVDALKAQITEAALAEAKPLMDSAKTVPQWEEAAALLEGKARYDDKNNRLAGQLQRCRQERDTMAAEARRYLETANQHVARQQWKDALASAEKAMAMHPTDEGILAARARILELRDQFYERSIRTLCAQGNWERATSVLREFLSELPPPPPGLSGPLRTLVADTMRSGIRQIAMEMVEQKKYFTAYRTILDANAPECEDLLETIRHEGSRYYEDLARQEKGKVRDFHAYVAAVKARILAPDSNDIFVLHRDCADFVDESIQIRIGISSFHSPENEKEAGLEFADTLITQIAHRLPYGVKIDEREKVDFAIDKEGLKEGVKVLGLNLAVFGNVSTLSVDLHQSEREITDWVNVPQTMPNPGYEQEMAQMHKQYGDDTSKWPRSPVALVTRDVLQQVKYKKGEVRMEGMIVVSVRLFSAVDRVVEDAITLTANRQAQDTFQGGVPLGKIQDDPLELPTHLNMKKDLMRDIVQKAADWVLAKLSQPQRAYYEKAQYHLDRREYDDAVKALAQGYLFCLSSQVPPEDESAAKIRRLLLLDLTEGRVASQ